MFGFLKDKLKKAVSKFSKDVEKETVVEKREVIVEESSPKEIHEPVTEPETPKKQGFFGKLFGGKKESEDTISEKEELIEELEEQTPIKIEEKIVEKPVIKEEPKSKIVETGRVIDDKPIPKTKDITFERESTPKEVKVEQKKIPVKENIKSDKPSEKRPVAKLEPMINFKRKEEMPIVVQPEIRSPSTISKVIGGVESEEMAAGRKVEKTEPIEKEEPKPDLKSLKRDILKEKPVKNGFFTKITETFTKFQLSEEKFEELFWELEVVLLENNVAVEVIDKIKADMKKELMAGKMTRRGVDEVILSTLRNSIIDLFDVEQINLLKMAKSKKPYVITVIGVNGSGKTTSIAKLTHLFQKNGLKVVLAASDTFRAAAIQQLEEHAIRLNTKLIKHDYNSDPAAVAFDAIKYAEAKDMDVVIIDTAGRLHSNTNLMKELEKVVRVCKPDIKIFVGESITGNDCVEQAKEFDRAVGIDAIILAKADVDEKGGAAISVSYVTQKPIIYLGTGQTYDDLKEFDPRLIIDSLEL
jgi:fused signal recognition particle receptor